MKNILDCLTWLHVEEGVLITGCDKSFEGALEVPVLIDGRPVVEIGETAFAKCEKITSVVLPDSVESVGTFAFSECSSLRRVVLPSTLEELARDAFDSDSNLETPEGALRYLTWEHVELGVRITGCDKSFEGSMVIPSLICGRPVVEISETAFAKCEKITSVVLPDSVEFVGNRAFKDCSELEELHLRAGIKKIKKGAFDSCRSLKSVEIPGTVESVGEYAFDNCCSLRRVVDHSDHSDHSDRSNRSNRSSFFTPSDSYSEFVYKTEILWPDF